MWKSGAVGDNAFNVPQELVQRTRGSLEQTCEGLTTRMPVGMQMFGAFEKELQH
jgi:hypothetical protein